MARRLRATLRTSARSRSQDTLAPVAAWTIAGRCGGMHWPWNVCAAPAALSGAMEGGRQSFDACWHGLENTNAAAFPAGTGMVWPALYCGESCCRMLSAWQARGLICNFYCTEGLWGVLALKSEFSWRDGGRNDRRRKTNAASSRWRKASKKLLHAVIHLKSVRVHGSLIRLAVLSPCSALRLQTVTRAK